MDYYFISNRVLLAKEQDPERWEREVEVMEEHTTARQQKVTWGADQVNIADFLVDHCKLKNKFNKELVQKVCGILEVTFRNQFRYLISLFCSRYNNRK